MAGSEPVDEFGDAADADELRRTAKRLQRQLAAAKTRSADLIAAVYQAAHDASVVVGAPPAVPVPQRRRGSGTREVAIVHASDWQVGKKTETFSSEVARERVVRLAEKVRKLTEIQRADHPVRECHLFLGGDMVEGVTVFPGQAWEVDSSDFDQLFTTVELEHMLVRELLSVFDVVHVDCEDGNHGRLGRKGEFPVQDNLDRISYRILADRLAGEKRVRLTLPGNWFQLPEVGILRPLLVHGDEIKSFGGNVPAYGILKKCNAWASGVLPPFGDVWMGHFHTPMTLVMARGTFIRVNGTLESGSEYAREFVAATGRPAQRLCFAEPERGLVTADYVVWLDLD